MIVNESCCIFGIILLSMRRKFYKTVQNFIPLMSVLTTLSYRKAGDPMCSAFALIIYSNNRCWRYPLICKAAAVRWCVYSTFPPVANLLIFKVVFYQHIRRVPRRLDSQSWACLSHSGPQRKTDAFLTHTVKKRKKKHAHRQTFINTPVYSCIQACVRLRSSMPKRCACVWAQPDTCVTQMTPPLPGCVYVGCIPRCGWRVDHVVHGTRGYVGSIVLGWSRNTAPPFAWSERNGSPPPQHGLLEHLRYGGEGGGRARPTPLQAESGVICPTANTTINLSRPLPSARASTGRPGDASALMTSSRDKRRTVRHKYCQRLADVWRTWWLPNNVCRGRTSGREEILLVPLLSFFRRFLWAHC